MFLATPIRNRLFALLFCYILALGTFASGNPLVIEDLRRSFQLTAARTDGGQLKTNELTDGERGIGRLQPARASETVDGVTAEASGVEAFGSLNELGLSDNGWFDLKLAASTEARHEIRCVEPCFYDTPSFGEATATVVFIGNIEFNDVSATDRREVLINAAYHSRGDGNNGTLTIVSSNLKGETLDTFNEDFSTLPPNLMIPVFPDSVMRIRVFMETFSAEDSDRNNAMARDSDGQNLELWINTLGRRIGRQTHLEAGDANQDLEFNQLDLVLKQANVGCVFGC